MLDPKLICFLPISLAYPSGEGGGDIFLFRWFLPAVPGLEEGGGGRHPVQKTDWIHKYLWSLFKISSNCVWHFIMFVTCSSLDSCRSSRPDICRNFQLFLRCPRSRRNSRRSPKGMRCWKQGCFQISSFIFEISIFFRQFFQYSFK